MNDRGELRHFSSSAVRLIVPAVCGICFVLGSFAALARGSTDTSIESVSEYIMLYKQSLANAGTITVDVADIFFQLFLFSALSFLSGFSILGVITIPTLMFVKGFLITYVSAELLSCCGAEYPAVVLLLVGIDAAVAVPCFFAVSSAALETSRSLLKTVAQGLPCEMCYNRAYFLRFAFIALVILVFAFIKKFMLEQFIIDAFSLCTREP